MPQLNPSPWFMILAFSWLVFIFIAPTKVMSHVFNNEPNPRTTETTTTNPWNWPWH
uniref:ATP synthase F0 subunit 8 n=1 Tax=Gymnothorax chilospilus TaxID=473452 RepID=UPI001FA7A871|nr:ATP synthase F0 subunit 8 [Gymnothorax chilospilus]YP_010852903.1 ATP synthase F0 subunit 8 [Gymnothorax reticularis]QSV37228.1 ATP synthase F0 subunit 8 [Gymnothorax chilospilus]WGL40719.1 ATP synthase F0 subunit 8 [Gymnothorax reticularis]WNH17256.1 ATP synthase F0 subunit 8 [Gymnothorax chilospilus]